MVKILYLDTNAIVKYFVEEKGSGIKPQVSNISRKKYNNEQTPQLVGAKKN